MEPQASPSVALCPLARVRSPSPCLCPQAGGPVLAALPRCETRLELYPGLRALLPGDGPGALMADTGLCLPDTPACPPPRGPQIFRVCLGQCPGAGACCLLSLWPSALPLSQAHPWWTVWWTEGRVTAQGSPTQSEAPGGGGGHRLGAPRSSSILSWPFVPSCDLLNLCVICDLTHTWGSLPQLSHQPVSCPGIKEVLPRSAESRWEKRHQSSPSDTLCLRRLFKLDAKAERKKQKAECVRECASRACTRGLRGSP